MEITGMLKYTHVSVNGERQVTIPFLNFKFKFRLPKPRKARKIIERDWLGRIVHSKPPKISKTAIIDQ